MSFLFEIQVSGIRCTGCANKIVTTLNQIETVEKVNVNVLAEKVQVRLNNKNYSTILNKLHELNFPVIGDPMEINFDSDQNIRSIFFKVNLLEHQEKIKNKFLDVVGIHELSVNPQCIIKVSYNPILIKARTIYDMIKEEEFYFEISNPYLDQFKKRKKKSVSIELKDLIYSLIIILIYLLLVLFLPLSKLYDDEMVFPLDWNIFSLYLIGMFLFTSLVVKFYGISTFVAAWKNFYQYRTLNMESLITLGSVSSFIMALALMIEYSIQVRNKSRMGEMDDQMVKEDRLMKVEMIVHMFETTGLILAIVNLGKYLEGKAKQNILNMTEQIFPEEMLTTNNILTYIEPKNKQFVIHKEQNYEISLLDKGDIIKLQAPCKLLLDGIVVHIPEGQTMKAVDSVCYGYDDEFIVKKGDKLISGADIKQGIGYMQIEGTIDNSMLSKISKQLNVAQNESESSETGLQALFQKLSRYFVITIIGISVIVLLVWLFIIATYDIELEDEYCIWCYPFLRAISVLVASCPCALGLAIPSVIVITLNLAMKNSILIKTNRTFENVLKIGSVVFDKTGTLFNKIEEISEVRLLTDKYTLSQVWEILYLLETDSDHPLAELIYKTAIKNIDPSQISYQLCKKIEYTKTGLISEIYNQQTQQIQEVVIGNLTIMENQGVDISQSVRDQLNIYQNYGKTTVMLSIGKEVSLLILIDNTANLRPESQAVVQYLQNKLNMGVYILSGDAQPTVNRVGEFLNIPEQNLFGEIDAEKKMKVIQTIKKKTKKEVMMIGDGMNDILSIQEACVGVSINAKSEMNLIASDVVILNQCLWRIVTLFNFMKYARIFILINLFWAFAYNIFILPVASGALMSFNINISPVLASAAMSGSSLVVVTFSSFLRCMSFDPSVKIKQNQIVAHTLIDIKVDRIRSSTDNKRSNFFSSINQNKKSKTGYQKMDIDESSESNSKTPVQSFRYNKEQNQ